MKGVWVTFLLLLLLGAGPRAALATPYVVLPFPDDPAAAPAPLTPWGSMMPGKSSGGKLLG
jgi:hypothetical protein